MLINHMRSAIHAGVVFGTSMNERRRALRSGVIAVMLIALIALIARASSVATAADQSELSGETACNEIRSDVSRMAKAERAEADALQLVGQGGDLAAVASQLNELLAKVAVLRDTLHKISQSRLTKDPDVANCLKLGYQALYEAEKLTTEVEQILLQQVGCSQPAETPLDERWPRAS